MKRVFSLLLVLLLSACTSRQTNEIFHENKDERKKPEYTNKELAGQYRAFNITGYD